MDRSLPAPPRRLRYAVAVSAAVVVLYASVIEPGDSPPPVGGGTAILHVAAYAVLAGLFGFASGASDRRTLLVAAAVATTYGAAIEVIQGFLPYRTASLVDVVLNAAGATLGALSWRAVARFVPVVDSGEPD